MSHKAKPAKSLCERHQRQVKISTKIDVGPCSNAVNKNRSTGALNNAAHIVKPKKTTKSDCMVSDNTKFTPVKPNNCRACGDATNAAQKKKSKMSVSINVTGRSGDVQQYFRNKNFRQSSASIHGAETMKKTSNLNTINERSEENLHLKAVAEISSESSDEESDGKAAPVFGGKTALDDIGELKKFRCENYFECHSAAKLKGSTSVASLTDHRCVYRFYLNERLFPVPVRTDYNNVIRCTDCQLPLEGPHKDGTINGTIQAKVKVNGQLQDVTLLLPVKSSLVVKERRRDGDRKEEDPLYFGIVRLSRDGDSMFKRNLPSDSLALRYQRGYQEYVKNGNYEYEGAQPDDVIVI